MLLDLNSFLWGEGIGECTHEAERAVRSYIFRHEREGEATLRGGSDVQPVLVRVPRVGGKRTRLPANRVRTPFSSVLEPSAVLALLCLSFTVTFTLG